MPSKSNCHKMIQSSLCFFCLQSCFRPVNSFSVVQNPFHPKIRTSVPSPATKSRAFSIETNLYSTKPEKKEKQQTKAEKVRKSKVSPAQSYRKRRLPNVNRLESGALYQRDAMLQHEILDKEAEVILSERIISAKRLRDEMTRIIEKKKLDSFNDFDGFDEFGGDTLWGGDGSIYQGFSDDEEEYDEMSSFNLYEKDEISSDSDVLSQLQGSLETLNFDGDQRISSTLVKDGSKLSLSSLDADISLLTDDDILNKLKIQGGREELKRQIHLGAEARTTLMQSNIRLVVSISKKWIGKSYAAGGKEGAVMANLYNGGWDRPSLDEVVQEGVLGLARAVDKFDPARGLRFSTYSTHWITSYVRQCFQSSTTGCLKVPSQLHEIKNTYKKVVKTCVESSEPIPSEEEIASIIGCSLNRLRTALRVTNPLISIDEPIVSSGNAALKGSGAGGDKSGSNEVLILDRLECKEAPPEDYVEVSFLRQSLENAMAAELSPHERDIVRLRLGLDDGQSRTIKQIVDACGGGITVADVRSTERRALKKLRSPSSIHSHNLVAYLDMVGIDDFEFPKRQ